MSETKLKKSKPNVIQVFFKVFPTAFKAQPVLFILCLLISLAHGLSFGMTTLFTQRFLTLLPHMQQGR